MASTPGFYLPDAPPPTSGGGDIDIDPAALAKLKTALRQAAEELETERFSDVHLDDGAFGGCPSGAELGAEHRTAHAIIADTIQGVVTDLWGYRDGVEQFEAGMGTADETDAAPGDVIEISLPSETDEEMAVWHRAAKQHLLDAYSDEDAAYDDL